jgi:2-polyprenyl-3-methyl-5-hydroxy-6-metoxy-1,4-benzoquinol methylase
VAPGAGRLIEWTGERCVPWAEDAPIAYEHYHRYLWAGQLVRGRRVLDLGSGEGFGAAILAETAVEVLGVDVDEAAVLHSRANHIRPNLRFEQGSASDLSAIPSGSLDAVVAFEMIEHLSDQERVLSEVRRVLTGDGILVMSTPDSRLYGAASGQENPFHVRELTIEEFAALLRGQFANLEMWGQRTIAGSHMRRLGPGPGITAEPVGEAGQERDFYIERADGGWRATSPPAALFCVAVASNAPLPPVWDSSTLVDGGLESVRQAERAGATAVAERDALISHAHHHLNLREQEITALEARRVELEHGRAALEAELEVERAFRTRVELSVTWQMFQKARGAVYGLIGEESVLGRTLGTLLRLLGRITINRGR